MGNKISAHHEHGTIGLYIPLIGLKSHHEHLKTIWYMRDLRSSKDEYPDGDIMYMYSIPAAGGSLSMDPVHQLPFFQEKNQWAVDDMNDDQIDNLKQNGFFLSDIIFDVQAETFLHFEEKKSGNKNDEKKIKKKIIKRSVKEDESIAPPEEAPPIPHCFLYRYPRTLSRDILNINSNDKLRGTFQYVLDLSSITPQQTEGLAEYPFQFLDMIYHPLLANTSIIPMHICTIDVCDRASVEHFLNFVSVCIWAHNNGSRYFDHNVPIVIILWNNNSLDRAFLSDKEMKEIFLRIEGLNFEVNIYNYGYSTTHDDHIVDNYQLNNINIDYIEDENFILFEQEEKEKKLLQEQISSAKILAEKKQFQIDMELKKNLSLFLDSILIKSLQERFHSKLPKDICPHMLTQLQRYSRRFLEVDGPEHQLYPYTRKIAAQIPHPIETTFSPKCSLKAISMMNKDDFVIDADTGALGTQRGLEGVKTGDFGYKNIQYGSGFKVQCVKQDEEHHCTPLTVSFKTSYRLPKEFKKRFNFLGAGVAHSNDGIEGLTRDDIIDINDNDVFGEGICKTCQWDGDGDGDGFGEIIAVENDQNDQNDKKCLKCSETDFDASFQPAFFSLEHNPHTKQFLPITPRFSSNALLVYKQSGHELTLLDKNDENNENIEKDTIDASMTSIITQYQLQSSPNRSYYFVQPENIVQHLIKLESNELEGENGEQNDSKDDQSNDETSEPENDGNNEPESNSSQNHEENPQTSRLLFAPFINAIKSSVLPIYSKVELPPNTSIPLNSPPNNDQTQADSTTRNDITPKNSPKNSKCYCKKTAPVHISPNTLSPLCPNYHFSLRLINTAPIASNYAPPSPFSVLCNLLIINTDIFTKLTPETQKTQLEPATKQLHWYLQGYNAVGGQNLPIFVIFVVNDEARGCDENNGAEMDIMKILIQNTYENHKSPMKRNFDFNKIGENVENNEQNNEQNKNKNKKTVLDENNNIFDIYNYTFTSPKDLNLTLSKVLEIALAIRLNHFVDAERGE
jgi:hypothetical protein